MAYHDITSHYNAYFNSSEKLKGVLQTAEQTHKDKFDSVIAVYAHNDPQEFTSYGSDLDDVVKRSTQAIQYHNISNWSDDHLLLIGKVNYLKGDYDKASTSFKYITTEYKEGVDYVKERKREHKKVGKYIRKKKKKKKPQVKVVVKEDGTKSLEKIDNRPSISVWVHTPARSEALVWLIKTYTRQKKYDEAASVVTYVKNDDLFFKNFDPQVSLAEADLEVTRKNYNAAIEPLENYLKAKKIRKKKKLKVRPLFVLAQCYEQIGNYKKAIDNYKEVLKSHPNYDMEFYAKLKMAKLGRGGDNNSVRNLLAKMAKDGKYKDYWDQVYYELALISLQENNRDQARAYLHKSIDNSIANDDQKAVSYLKLAEMDYQDEAYVSSKFFYDSTLTFMAKNDNRYPPIDERDKMLDNLVQQLNIIATEDSLQKLASLSKEELEATVKNMITQKEQAEIDKKAQEDALKQQQQLNTFQNNPNNTNNTTQQNQQSGAASNWYFYNSSARASGYNTFLQKWGRRKLEENWRRKDKSGSSFDEETTPPDSIPSDTAASQASANTTPSTPEEQLLAGVPTTPEKLSKSNDRLVDAYYTAATIYKDGLDNYDKAELMFETLNSRVPNHKLLLESYYNLYLIAKHKNDAAKTEKYKNLILAKFPESVIAKILKDPNYINQTLKKEQVVNDYYYDTYSDYENGRLDSAWYKAKMSDVTFKPNPLSAKFELLLALILAKQNRLADYVQALQKLSAKSTDAEVKKTATDLLAGLNKSSLPQIDLSQDTARRDSLNAMYLPQAPTSSTNPVNGAVNPTNPAMPGSPADTTGGHIPTAAKNDTATGKPSTAGTSATTDTTKTTAATPPVVTEDTTSPYQRSDASVHYFIVYIKDPAASQSDVMSIMAKIDAFNSSQMPERRLQTKQVIINSTNKLLNVRQFKNREEVMAYYNILVKQSQLFSDLKPEQYAITAISTINFATLLSEKDIDAYNKFFRRVYK
jgi:tetratricopeptide (TPR) repeat protein